MNVDHAFYPANGGCLLIRMDDQLRTIVTATSPGGRSVTLALEPPTVNELAALMQDFRTD